MNPIVITAARAHGYHSNLDFRVDRPDGLREYLVLHLLTPTRVHFPHGIEYAGAGSCLIYTPGFPQCYEGDGVLFGNDYCHAAGRGIAPLLRRYALPRNRLFRPRFASMISPLIQAMQLELTRSEVHWQTCASLLFHQLCIQLARGMNIPADSPLSAVDELAFLRLRQLRVDMFDTLEQRWTVAQMARRSHMSRSRFAVLYPRFFGVSPMEDLIRARLQRAQQLLTNRSLPIHAVAVMVGFQNIYYFSRLFHRRVGCPPSQFYQQHVGK